MPFRHILALSGFAALFAIGTAQATVFTGTGTFADTGSAKFNLTGTARNAEITNLNLSLGQSVSFADFLDVSAKDTAASLFGTTKTDAIEMDFAFSLPSSGTGTLTGGGTDTAFKLLGVIAATAGSITWNNPGVVTFTDGAILDVSLSSAGFASFGPTAKDIDVKATFKMVQAPTSVPEPGSVMLLGTGLVGLGLILRRRGKA